MTQRIRLDDLTSDQLDRLYDRLDAYRDSRRRWLEAAFKDRRVALAAHDALDRVRALHHQDGDHCAICTEDFGRLNAPWPCPTIRALDEPAPGTAATQATGIRGLLEHVGIDTTGRDITVAGQVVDAAPREHCGHLSPETQLTSPRTECVLRPGHTGSHADDVGCRWWPITEEPS